MTETLMRMQAATGRAADAIAKSGTGRMAMDTALSIVDDLRDAIEDHGVAGADARLAETVLTDLLIAVDAGGFGTPP